jgi:hypothetical protein
LKRARSPSAIKKYTRAATPAAAGTTLFGAIHHKQQHPVTRDVAA